MATVKRYHYDSHDELQQHLRLFIDAYNRGRRLDTLRGLTPTNISVASGQKTQLDSKSDPYRLTSGLNT